MIRSKFKERVLLVATIVAVLVLLHTTFVWKHLDGYSKGTMKYMSESGDTDSYLDPAAMSRSSSRLFKDIDEFDASELRDYVVPNTVHYVWCYRHTIRYEHYLSILSAWKFMRPDIIEFHCRYNISMDDTYNMWLQELKSTIPGLVVKNMPENWDFQQYGDCGYNFGLAVLHDRGGMYISENVTLLKSLIKFRENNFTLGLNTRGDVTFLIAARKEEKIRELVNLKFNHELSLDTFKGTMVCSIVNPSRFFTVNDDNQCVVLPEIHPVDIMYSNTTVGEIARKLTYGNSDLIKTVPLLPGKIPKYVHLAWYHRKEMTFMMYLSIRSALVILNPEKVFIHGDKELRGEYFDKVRKDPRVVLVYREIPHYIYGNKVLFTQHRSDIIRADVLLKYGGIYMDWDVLWLKPVDDLIATGYDAVVNFDHNTRNGYPDSMNLGVFMAKKNSHFVRFWQDSLINYKSKDFYHNALELPYKTFEKYPHTVHIEKHLQVMCFQLKCHPIWLSHYNNIEKDPPFHWRREAYAIHFTHPDPPEYANETALRDAKGRFADIGQYIMKTPNKYVI